MTVLENNKPRILYLGFNRSYTNPTAELILRILGRVSDFECYGPGFSDETSLVTGIENWIKEQPDFDFLVVDSYVLECENIMTREKPFVGDFLRFDPSLFYKYSLNYQQYFLKHQGSKIFLSNWDIYNITEANISKLINSGTYVLEGGISTTNSKAQIEAAYGKPFKLGNDNWYHFVNNHKDKIISFPHFISSTEFDFSPLYTRQFQFNVVGAPYDERKEAIKLLTQTQKRNNLKEKIKLKIKQRTMGMSMSELFLNEHRSKYFESISKSKLCFCSGGPWLYPVRKYFEIPGRGSVSIGWKCTGFENLGFKDGVNFIVAQNNHDILNIMQRGDDIDLQNIASNGRNLIWEFHSEKPRMEQLSDSLNRIKNNNFKGSFWKDGVYLHY
jgi:hypothetical protein